MPTAQEQIDTLQGQIDAIKGDVQGVTPAGCNIASLKATVAGYELDIKALRATQITEENPFNGTTMSLRLGNGNIPSLTGVNPAAVSLINAIGAKPSAVVMGGVTVAVAGNGVVVSATNESDVMAAVGKLAAFADTYSVNIDVTQLQTMKAGNMNKADQFLTTAQNQEDILIALLASNVQITPLKPDIGVPDVIVDDPTVTIDAVITGMEPITVDIDWGDSETDTDVSLPATHEYEMSDIYTITITATNDAGSDTKTITDVEVEVLSP